MVLNIRLDTLVMKGIIKRRPGSVQELSMAPPLLYTPICPVSITWKAPAAHRAKMVSAV